MMLTARSLLVPAADVLGTEAMTIPLRATALLLIALLALLAVAGWETALRRPERDPDDD